MRKLTALLLSLLLLGAASGCGAKSADGGTAAFRANGSVIFERNGVKVTTAGLDTDPTSTEANSIIWLDIENTSGQDAFLGVSDGSVNGFMDDVYLISFYEEDGEYYGGDYAFQQTVPAGGGRYALGCNHPKLPGVRLEPFSELTLCFTMAEDEYTSPGYVSAPVTIVTGEAAEAVELDALGTGVIDNARVKVVFGDQDYDDWLGPFIYMYTENKTDRYIALAADTAVADGVACEMYSSSVVIAPGKRNAEKMFFDEALKELRGFEHLNVRFRLCEADNPDGIDLSLGTALELATVMYPPQVWGEYENGGLHLTIKPRYNALVTVEAPENDADGVLFTVSETASLEAGNYDGAGWLLSIGTVDEARLHEMLCADMSGASAFAKDASGRYYVYYHPTDVRYERATVEEMQRDSEQWSMVSEWAAELPDAIVESNGLERVSYGNSDVDIYLARAAYQADANFTLSTTEYGPVAGAGVNGARYAEFVMRGMFTFADAEEAPDGEYVVLNFPDEEVRLDFFFAPGGYVRVTSSGYETLYQAMWTDDNISYAEAMRGWYYAAAEQAGVKAADTSLDAFVGAWAERIAGRGMIEIEKSVAPGKAWVKASWPESAAVLDTWELVASLDADGRLAYENGHWNVSEYDETGEGWTTDESWEETGFFYLNDAGELGWHDQRTEHDGEDSVFIRVR